MTHLAKLADRGHDRPGLAMLPPVRAVYQPVVDLVSGDTVAFEALARGPRGTEWELPASLFADARRHDVVAALDWECRAAAISGALRRRLPASMPLFVNAAPAGLGTSSPAHLSGLVDQGARRLQLVIDIPEPALLVDPGRVLDAAARLRAAGYGLSLDDVGGHPPDAGLIPRLNPDVVKLDLVLLTRRSEPERTDLLTAVREQVAGSGAILLAERIETADALETAQRIGARLGQGWQLGRPGPMPAEPAVMHHELSFTRAGRT